jgi:hypothetical protein
MSLVALTSRQRSEGLKSPCLLLKIPLKLLYITVHLPVDLGKAKHYAMAGEWTSMVTSRAREEALPILIIQVQEVSKKRSMQNSCHCCGTRQACGREELVAQIRC